MRILLLLTLSILLHGCATPVREARPPTVAAEVRVGFDAARDTSVRTQGLADRATRRPVTAEDPVRVASVSKLVVALGVLRLVEAGQLELDRDVSAYLGWSLRNPAFPDTPVTLRQLLSQRASLVDGVDYIVPLGTRLSDALADPRAWDDEHAPGTYFRYANIGSPVIATVIERATGERFDRVMAREVLAPLNLDACFNWGAGCSDAAVGRAVVLYRANGEVARDDLGGARPACPVVAMGGCDLAGYRVGDNGSLFGPQGGLRISMRDLARVGRMLLRNGAGFLTPASIAMLERPIWRYDGSNGDTSSGFYCSYGLANQTLPTARAGCADDLFADGARWSGHAGEAYALRAGLWIDRKRGRGVAFFATAVADGSKGRSAFSAEEERLAR